jgi:hypothetical protein
MTEPPMHGDMACRACGWWPPVVRVRHDMTEPASDAWRWQCLREHIEETASIELDEGQPDSPHSALIDALEARAQRS